MMQYKTNRIAATFLMLLCDLSVMAAPLPDSGQTIRELQQQPELSLPNTTPLLQPASAPVAAPVLAPTPIPAEIPAPEPVHPTTTVTSTPQPAPESAPETVSGKTLVENKLVTIEYSNFIPGTVRLKPENGIELGKALKFARKNPDAKLKIIGYTDSKSKPLLSLGYADSVRNYLVTKGVAGNRISIEGAGSANPVADNQTCRSARCRNTLAGSNTCT
jgi:outer membrane protein OmpA-like peptidoglycan-associated protein